MILQIFLHLTACCRSQQTKLNTYRFRFFVNTRFKYWTWAEQLIAPLIMKLSRRQTFPGSHVIGVDERISVRDNVERYYMDNGGLRLPDWSLRCFSMIEGNSTNTSIHTSPSFLLKHRKPQPSNKLSLPTIPSGIVAYAFTPLWDNLCRNRCTMQFTFFTFDFIYSAFTRKRYLNHPTAQIQLTYL